MDLVNSVTNPLVDCEQSIKSIDLGAWKESGYYFYTYTIKCSKTFLDKKILTD
jgi:hypothetical protein